MFVVSTVILVACRLYPYPVPSRVSRLRSRIWPKRNTAGVLSDPVIPFFGCDYALQCSPDREFWLACFEGVCFELALVSLLGGLYVRGPIEHPAPRCQPMPLVTATHQLRASSPSSCGSISLGTAAWQRCLCAAWWRGPAGAGHPPCLEGQKPE